jgi:hypothetical protein
MGGVSNKVKGKAASANNMARNPHDHKKSVSSTPMSASKKPSENYPGKAMKPSMVGNIKGLKT